MPSDAHLAKCWWCRRSTFRTIGLLIFITVYLVVGAIVFAAIEGPKEEELRASLIDIRSDFLRTHSQCLTDGELEAFIVEIVKANERGVSAISNVSSEPNWSFGQSLFFAGTILTTIGYGHTTPLSEGGKVFCIIYALLGIPLTLIMFTAVVERLMIPSSVFLKWLNKKMEHLYRPMYIRLFHLFTIVVLLMLFVFLIPSAILSWLEMEWNYLDAFYYCFISMTTIGLGDYIPGDNPSQKNRAVYKILTTVYLLIGLIIMMFALAVVYEIPELNLGFHFYMKSDEDTDEEKVRLKDAEAGGPKYKQQINDGENTPVD